MGRLLHGLPLICGFLACFYGVLDWHSQTVALREGREAPSSAVWESVAWTRKLWMDDDETNERRLLLVVEEEEEEEEEEVVVFEDEQVTTVDDAFIIINEGDDIDPDSEDDDVTRDAVCRQYVMNFLNGTTSAKDECEGMYNAWKGAQCQDDGTVHIVAVMNGLVDEDDKNDTIVPDDDFENWQCCNSISDYYEKHCKPPQINAMKLCGICVVLVICAWMKYMLRVVTKIRWIPDAAGYIVVGALVGAMMRLFSVVENKFAFDNDLFLQVMLPPIIFEAALTIDKNAFRRDLFPILTYAILGTGMSAVGIGYITYHMSRIFASMKLTTAQLPFLDSLLFGALMSSIDPVATLGILSSVGVSQDDTLYNLVFGESLMNDGVSIVLFDSLIRHMGDKNAVSQATVADVLWNFVCVTAGSTLVGIVCGALSTLFFWTLQKNQSAVTEVALFFAWALIPYYVADGLHFSGIIGIMVMGFMMDYYVIGGFQSEEGEWMEYMQMRNSHREHSHGSGAPASARAMSSSGDDEHDGGYFPQLQHPVEPRLDRVKEAFAQAFSGRGHLLNKSRQHVHFCAELISSVMETAIFCYLGVFLFTERDWNFSLMTTGIMACLSSRAAMVLALSFLINVCVYIDLEVKLGQLFHYIAQGSSRYNITLVDDEDSVSGGRIGNSHGRKVYLGQKTQLILFSAGVRGAVSYALVQNIPLYNAVTKHGSNYKGELKAMTSATIVVLLFFLGAITFFSMQGSGHGGNMDDDDEPRTGARTMAGAGDAHEPLMERLTSTVDSEEATINSLEIDWRTNPRPPQATSPR